MKERDVGGEMVAFGREVGGAKPVESCLILRSQGEGEDQRRRVERWLELTRVVLPGMAAGQRWPIRFDHCFMRVLLDNAMAGIWRDFIAPPAIRHIKPADLQRAIALAEAVLADPALLPALNRRSLAWRRVAPV